MYVLKQRWSVAHLIMLRKEIVQRYDTQSTEGDVYIYIW